MLRCLFQKWKSEIVNLKYQDLRALFIFYTEISEHNFRDQVTGPCINLAISRKTTLDHKIPVSEPGVCAHVC
jgi:hypothetical protein